MTQREPGNNSYRVNTQNGNERVRRVSDGQTRTSEVRRVAPDGQRRPAGSRSTSQSSQRRPANAQRRPDNAVRRPSNGQRPQQKRRKKKGHGGLIAVVILILAVIVALIVIIASGASKNAENATTETETEVLAGPPAPAVESTATIGATGDILLHNPILVANDMGGSYDFNDIFTSVTPVWSSVDYMVANLEVTLGGGGYGSYTSYPMFNSPDEIIDALSNAGVDMLLTANNHSYDSGEDGMYRTLDVIDSYNIDHIGTRSSEDESFVEVKEINGITFGMVCYTYDTREYTGDQKSLNGNTMTDTAAVNVHSFSYSYLDEFYESAQDDLDEMEEAGCDVTIFFMHWGNEYQDEPCDDQVQMAQKLADLGVDVIIGGHPHVIQKFDELTGVNGNTTYCLYSMGNALSNQRKSLMDEDGNRGYTEDGLTIEISYMKFNNGKVKLASVEIIPTWVDVTDYGAYSIVPLQYENGSSSWATSHTSDAIASYERTIGRVGDKYGLLREALGLEAPPTTIQ